MFSIRLKELREKAGYSQAQLAKKIGVGQSTVGMWENGKNKPQNAKLEMLATLFDVSIDYLLGRIDDPNGVIQDVSQESLSEMRYALDKKTKDFTDNEIADLIDLANIIVARRNRQKE